MTQLKEDAIVAITTAAEKRLREIKIDARKELESQLLEEYDKSGFDRKNLIVEDQVVGSISINYWPEGFDIVDAEAFNDFALTNGLGEIQRKIKPECISTVINYISINDPALFDQVVTESVIYNNDWEKLITLKDGVPVISGTDEVVPGVKYRSKTPKNTVVRGCELDTVRNALAFSGVNVAGLLLGGE